MKIVVGVTDNRWASFLRDRADIGEANFWQPPPHSFKALPEGGPFLFKTKDPTKYRDVDIPGDSLVGGGFFEEYLQLRVSEAWTIWGTGNGAASEADLLDAVHRYQHSSGLQLRRSLTAPTDATDVQHHRRRCLDSNDLENGRFAIDADGVGQHERALAPRHERGLLLHICCTPAPTTPRVDPGMRRNRAPKRPKSLGCSVLTVRTFGTSATSTLSLGAFERRLAPALAQFVFNRCDHLGRRNREKYGAAAQAPTSGAPIGRLHLVAGGAGLPPKTNRAHAAWQQMSDFENAFVTLHDRGQEIYQGKLSFTSLAEADEQEAETLDFFDNKVAKLVSQGCRLVRIEGRSILFQP